MNSGFRYSTRLQTHSGLEWCMCDSFFFPVRIHCENAENCTILLQSIRRIDIDLMGYWKTCSTRSLRIFPQCRRALHSAHSLQRSSSFVFSPPHCRRRRQKSWLLWLGIILKQKWLLLASRLARFQKLYRSGTIRLMLDGKRHWFFDKAEHSGATTQRRAGGVHRRAVRAIEKISVSGRPNAYLSSFLLFRAVKYIIYVCCFSVFSCRSLFDRLGV